MLVNETRVTRINASAVKSRVIQAAEAGDTVLDWSGVTAVDSSTVAIVLAWLRVLQKKNLVPQLVAVPEKMLSLMRLYGTYQLIEPTFAKK
ncbi:MAG: STAS domain-containing protein [Sutterellaceae bacterium]|nr:STAS domain-containing protein [Sutterellaceae bacterium]